MFRMWIKTIVLVGCVVAALAADNQRSKKKDDARGKRNLQYNIAHHYAGPHNYQLERRISTGPQIPSLYQSQYFPGPLRSYSPYHKGRPYSLPPPPYAVQMEPLVHYSQRDPLYDTNSLSLNADGQDDLLTDNNHLNEHVYGPHPQKHIIERPIYIKEPEPIIEIIIKESNVTLPPPPAPPAPPPKKKEQVQVFYVKYKKNPNGHGKDSIIYDKPIPAISPPIEDEHEEPPPQHHHHHHQEAVTSPPPPSTTLRTVIHPDSETYHSPSGIKVTFGKEGFDYSKRSNKPDDLKASPDDNRSVQFPQGRQLSSFPPSPRRPPPSFSFNPQSGSFRQPQPYRPFRQAPRPQEYSTLPKFPEFSQPPKNSQNFPPPRPVPPQFHRQPVPYQPFETLRHQSPQFRPETHFPITQSPPITQKPVAFNPFTQQRPQFNEPKPQEKPAAPHQYHQLPRPSNPQRPQFEQRPLPLQHQQFEQRPLSQHQQIEQRPFPQHQQIEQRPLPQHQQIEQRPLPQHQQFEQRPQHQQFQQQQFNHQASIIPPGGELIHSVPKYEQHISVQEPSKQSQFQTNQQPQQSRTQSQFQANQQQSQGQSQFQKIQQPQQGRAQSQFPTNQQTQQSQGQSQFQKNQQLQQARAQSQFPTNQQHQYHIQPQLQQSTIQLPSTKDNSNSFKSQPNHNTKIEEQLREANAFQESIRQSSPQYYNFQQSQSLDFYQSTSKPSTPKSTTYSTTTTTKPSTTTKDPKVLNAQLPDEVPDDLRQQLLSSGILNNADISVLDYDKVGDIPLSALPPDQLANFYSAGGAQQIQSAGSEPVPAIARQDFDTQSSEIHEVKVKPEVEMKVVRYNPESEQGQQVQDAYVKDDATQVEPVNLNDDKYNRYLPLKVSGAQFPIPDVPELKGKKISSVVVLAPVAYDFSSSRTTREAKNEEVELLEDRSLKELLNNPTKENFEKFLKKENQTKSAQQSVILLVTGPNSDTNDKEIFMYDVATQTVSKLDGELSSAFVDAAEANSSADTKASASEIVETRVPYDVPIIDPQGDLETEASEHLESFVDVSGNPIDDLTASESHIDNNISAITKTGRLL